MTGERPDAMKQPSLLARRARDWLAYERKETLLTWIGVAGVLALAFAFKFQQVQQDLALGFDPANYLVTMHALFGSDITGLGLARPPLIAIPMKLFTSVLGTLTGIQVLGVLAAVSIGIPFFLLAHRVVGRYVALVTTLLFLFSVSYSSMIAWGFLTFFGIFFVILTSCFLLLLLAEPSRKYAILTGLSGSLLVGFHQVSSLQFLLIIVPFLGLFLFLYPSRFTRAGKSLALAIVVGGVLSLIYAPSYLLALREGGSPQLNGPVLPEISWQGGLTYLANFHPSLAVAVPVAIAALIGLVLLWRTHRDIALLLLAIGVISVSGAFISTDAPGSATVLRRLPYLSYIPFWLLAGVTLSALLDVNGQSAIAHALSQRIPGRDTTLLVVVSAALGLLFSQTVPDAQERLTGAMNYYSYLDRSLWKAAQWAGANTPPASVFAAHPKVFGWWLEGASRRNTYETRDADSFYQSQAEESRVADLLLSRYQGLSNGTLRAAITDPYPSTAGDGPVIGVFVAGMYRDVMLFRDQDIFIKTTTGQMSLDSMPSMTRLVKTKEDGPVVETIYYVEPITVVRTIRLDSQEPEAVVSYALTDADGVAQSFVVDMNLTHGQGIQLEQTGVRSFRKEQHPRSFMAPAPVITETHVESTGAEVAVFPSDEWGNHMIARADFAGPKAVVSFHVRVVSPEPQKELRAEHYEVPDLLREHNIEYIAVDTMVSSPLANDLPQRTVWWLDEAPYLELVFEDEDVKVYRATLADSSLER